MEYILSLIENLEFLCFIVLFLFLKKWWNSFDTYFEQKATNLATKQDIREITTITESIQSEFHQKQSQFDADLQYKYDLNKSQYTELYSPLYWIICKSEATRNSFKHFSNLSISFSDAPITKYEDNTTTIDEIITLIEEKKDLASPNLIKLATSILVIKQELLQRSPLEAPAIQQKLIQVTVALVKTIINDYQTLRKELHLPTNDEVSLLENNQYIDW